MTAQYRPRGETFEIEHPGFASGCAPNTCLGADENEPFLKMAERQDWALFRTVEGLQQKAGVPAGSLRRLALKELADNALDNGGPGGINESREQPRPLLR
jgi:hypothetical protein